MVNRDVRRCAIVTGAASGIGKAAAFEFGKQGWSVVLADRDAAGAERLANELASLSVEALPVETDVTNPGQVEAMVAAGEARFGVVTAAFNCAGVEGPLASVHETSLETWKRVLDVNLSGVFYSMRAEIPAMLRAGRGAIVNMASVAGLCGVPQVVSYVAAKAGVIGATRSAALDYAARGIRINAVCPGGVRTPLLLEGRLKNLPDGEAQAAAFHPIGRIAEPQEIAAAVVWLCSDAASFVTGVALPVDGGFSVP